MNKLLRILLILALLANITGTVIAQSTLSGSNTITTAVPFLAITPDSRAGGMGDAGVGTSADVNSQYWNPSKYIFMESDMGVGLSYSPWLRNLVDDINLAYLTGYKKLDDVQAISASLRYFALGDIVFTDNTGTTMSTQSPNEFSIDIAYTRKLSDVFSGAVALRYIRSDITAGQEVDGIPTYAGNAYAADVAFYYYNEFRRSRKDNSFAAGINIQNIGSKISYDEGETKDFIPTTMKLGASYTVEADAYNSFCFTLEANKLLVPTVDTAAIADGSVGTASGINQGIGVIEGIFKSFSDAPGGMSEELKEVTWSLGVEYWYNKQFALRAGYFYEDKDKGNRKFITAGAGLKLNVFSLDFSYLIATQSNHPLANTLRFSLAFDVDAFQRQR